MGLDKKQKIQLGINIIFSVIYFSNMYQDLPIHSDTQDKKFFNISTSYLIDKYSKDNQNEKFVPYSSQYNLLKSKSIENVLKMIKDENIVIPFDIPKRLI
ncbi:MAG: hypothetical protein Q9M40_01985 [Sulfurimonas sp.]|nr:hypothetical protein [Sulfurimonas sp.]